MVKMNNSAVFEWVTAHLTIDSFGTEKDFRVSYRGVCVGEYDTIEEARECAYFYLRDMNRQKNASKKENEEIKRRKAESQMIEDFFKLQKSGDPYASRRFSIDTGIENKKEKDISPTGVTLDVFSW